MGHRCCNGRSESAGEGRILCFRDIAAFGAFLGSSQWARGAVSNPRLYYQRTQSIAKIGVSRRLSIVIVQHPAELFLASDAAHFGQKLQRFDESVFHPLMIAPLAIVTDEN